MNNKRKVIFSVLAATAVVGVLCACADKSSGKKPQPSDSIQLAAPVIAIDGSEVSWNAVDNATGYDVYVNGDSVASITVTQYSLGGYTAAGTYVVKVRATSTDTAYSASELSNSVSYEITQEKVPLSAPVLGLSGMIVTWNAVDNAVGYSVYVDGSFYETVSDTVFDASDLTVGTHEICAVALSASVGAFADSAQSGTVVVDVAKKASRLLLVSEPTVTEYTVGTATALDLTGLAAEIHYSNAPSESISLTTEDIITDYDLSVVGRYEIEFEKNGAVGAGFRIYVNASDTAVAEYSVENLYTYSGDANNTGVGEWSAPSALNVVPDDLPFVPTSATALGKSLTLVGGNVPLSELATGENTVVLSDGENTATVSVLVAYGIDSAGAWLSMANGLDKYYVLTADIDFGSATAKQIGSAPLNMVWANEEHTIASTITIDRTGAGDPEAPGVAFTGVIDGAGHTVTGFTVSKSGYSFNERYKGCGTAMIGYLGKTGVIKNMTVIGASVRGMDYSSIIVGYYEGLVENIAIEEDCVVFNMYSHGAIVSAYNYGTVRNIVSFITGGLRNGSPTTLDLVRRDGDNTGELGINCYVGAAAATDLTSILGDGWQYLQGHGTIYGGENLRIVKEFDAVWYAGVNAEVTILSAAAMPASPYVVYSWGAYSGYVTVSSMVQNGCLYTYRLKVPSATTGGSLTIMFKFYNGDAYSCTIRPTVGAPFVTSIEDATNGGVTAVTGAAINLSNVDISLCYTDGSTQPGKPTGYIAGTYDSSKTGVTQSVTFYYLADNEYLYTVIKVTPEEPQSVYVTEILISAKDGVTSITYGSDPIDFDDYLIFKLKYSDDSEDEVTAAEAGIIAEEYKSGEVTVTFSYENDIDYTASGSIELELWKTVTTVAEFDAINDNLSGYYVLGANIDFGDTQHSIGCMPLTDLGDGTFCDLSDGLGTGVAFTGKFDGAGYTLSGFKSSYVLDFNGESFGRALFNYVGSGGEVYNFTLNGFDVKSTNYSAFVAACNAGTVKDITVGSSEIAANYGAAGAFVCYNYGTVSGCTSSGVTQFTKPDGSSPTALDAVYENHGTVTDCNVEG